MMAVAPKLIVQSVVPSHFVPVQGQLGEMLRCDLAEQGPRPPTSFAFSRLCKPSDLSLTLHPLLKVYLVRESTVSFLSALLLASFVATTETP